MAKSDTTKTKSGGGPAPTSAAKAPEAGSPANESEPETKKDDTTKETAKSSVAVATPKKTLEDIRLELAQQLQERRGNDLLVLGVPYIWMDMVEKVQNLLRDKKFKVLDIVLQTDGGDPVSAFKVAKMLRRHAEKINIIVADRAKSAGTLICLCADHLLMTEMAELGPLDMQKPEAEEGQQWRLKSSLNGSKALEQIQKHNLRTLDVASAYYGQQNKHLHPLDAHKLAIEFTSKTAGRLYDQLNPKEIAEYSRTLEEGEWYGRLILMGTKRMSEDGAFDIVSKLVHSYPAHSFVLDFEQLEKLGLPAECIDDASLCVLLKMVISVLPTDLEDEPFVHFQPRPDKA